MQNPRPNSADATGKGGSPPTLDYRPPRTRPFRRGAGRHRGPDSFLGCAAIFFSLLPSLSCLAGWLLGDLPVGIGLGVLPGGMAVLFGLVALLERETCKTFPLVAIALTGAYLFAAWVVLPWLRQG